MVLVREEIQAAGIVTGAVEKSRRATTYDATIGDIIFKGQVWTQNTFMLPKRGIVWVVSAEEFVFPATITGLATLKTTWTHKGILALNVGVIDPGWEGPLATAVINFSDTPFPITKGHPFFRVMMFQHKATTYERKVTPRDDYLAEIQEKAAKFSTTFLDMQSLVDDVAQAVFKAPRVAAWIGWSGLCIGAVSILVATAAIFAPIAIETWTDYRREAATHKQIEVRLRAVEANVRTMASRPDDVPSLSETQVAKNRD